MTTIIDVAKHAGVSFKTVSRVLNGESSVRPQTKERVLRSADILNYKVNSAARSLRSKKPHLVALLVDNPSRSYSQDVQIGAMAGCQQAGFTLVLGNPNETEALTRMLTQDGLLGAILTPPQSNDPAFLTMLRDAKVPFVRVGTEELAPGSNQVGIDDKRAAKDIMEHLIGLGHRRIGFICGPEDHAVSEHRKAGYKEALREAGILIEKKLMKSGNFAFASGLAGAEVLLTLENPPTAIFASNDDMAAGCLAAAYKHNVRVPERLSIAGFDDSPVARVIYPSLTTIHQSTREMCEHAVELLERKRREQLEGDLVVKMPHDLIIRESTGPVWKPAK